MLAMGSRTRTSIVLAVAFTTYCLVFLRLDVATNAQQQFALGLTAWAFLAVALRDSPPRERLQVLTMVGVATICECIGSILWGAYRYRLGNLPIYVPAGHGLFYLTALRVAELPLLRRHERTVIAAVFIGAVALLAGNLFTLPLPDLLGLVTFAVFVRFIVRGRYPLLYAVSFAMTMALEFYGTALGIWTWVPILPLLGLPAANPPAGIGAGYCAMDGLARRLAPRVERVLGRWRPVAAAAGVPLDVR
jgi:hypothetical protein